MSNQRPRLNLVSNMAKGRGKEAKQLFYFLSVGVPILGLIWASELIFVGEATDNSGRHTFMAEGINQLKEFIGAELTAFVVVLLFSSFGIFLFKAARNIG